MNLAISEQAMLNQQLQMANIASDIARAGTVDPINPELQDNNIDLIKAVTESIPTAIAYKANAGVIEVQNAVTDAVLDIKA